jgi:hypothetical protein
MKTAVEWLYEQMPKKIQPHYKRQLEQAKEMFEKQIIEAYRTGVWDLGCRSADSEEYYNRTFKQEKQCKCGQQKVGGYSCQRTDCNQNL